MSVNVDNCLCEWLFNNGISYEECAKACNTTPNTIQSIAEKMWSPSIYLGLVLSAYTEIPLEELFYLVKE